jgi:hypothetical protein
VTVRIGKPPVENVIGLGILLEHIDDPGAAGAIPVNRSGYVHLTTAAAETRTLAVPQWEGQILQLITKDITLGDCVVTASAAVNQAGNTVITFNTADESLTLIGIRVGAGTLAWRILITDAVGLA